jgi:hypothetical protein
MNETTFENAKVGDRVWWIELRAWGIIERIDAYIFVKFPNLDLQGFSLRGEQYSKQVLFWDEIPIVAPPRPKRMEKRVLDGWVNVYPEGPMKTFVFGNKEEVDRYNLINGNNRIACVHVTGEYEVEE